MTARNLNRSTHACLLTGLALFAFFLGTANRLEGQKPADIQPSGGVFESAPPASTASPSPRAGEETAQTLDQLLTQAMDRNPGIVTAKAKVALAQAELNAVQMEVSQRVISLWNDRKAQEAIAEKEERNYKALISANQKAPASVSGLSLDSSNCAVIEAQSKLARIQNELRSLIGQIPPAVQKSAAVSTPAAQSFGMKTPVQIPQGRLVNSIRKALDQKAQADFTEAPITDVVDYLRDMICQSQPEFKITIDLAILKNISTVTLNLKGVPLSAVLQAIEDQFTASGWQFVMRDYGLLLTTRDEAEKNGYLPMKDFIRQVASLEKDDLNQILNRKVDVKYDNVRIDNFLSSLLDPTGVQYEIDDSIYRIHRIRKSNVTLDSKGVTIGAILQTLEEKLELVQFVVLDDGIRLSPRDYAQKRGWRPLTEYLRQGKPVDQEKSEKPNLKIIPDKPEQEKPSDNPFSKP
jgi:hypothetical protein